MGNQTGEQGIRATIKVLEDELLHLEKEKINLLAHLHRVQDSIACTRVRAGNLKNSLVPVYRLPNEILQACFHQLVQFWLDENDGADEQTIMDQIYMDSEIEGFDWPSTPAVAISHVSQHWRQLVINMPSLWTNLIITPKFERHLDVSRGFFQRFSGMPISANFRSFGSEDTLSPAMLSLAEATVPKLLHAQQITALTFLDSGPVLSRLLSRMVEQPIVTGPPPLIVFSCLTTLSIVGFAGWSLNHLKSLLSATPQLKSLELEVPDPHMLYSELIIDQPIVCLPTLEKLTLIQSSRHLGKFLDSLSIPNLQELRLLRWHPDDDKRCLFVDQLPRFIKVQNLTIHIVTGDDFGGYLLPQYRRIIRAFSNVTHLTLRSLDIFSSSDWEGESSPISFWPNLQQLTLHFAFDAIEGSPRGRFSWLQKQVDRQHSPLQILVIDSSKKLSMHADEHLFCSYRELQEYGTVKGSRLDEFLLWQHAWFSLTYPHYNSATYFSEDWFSDQAKT
ncbi:hypothetical protein BJ138DRAFT_1154163 [Hygrophoropsis aurantiaca]|uniref:Uncharacterized protein n=1 Tax=Hygrophoropsis aurantiaca TaxID=72124 RepID=A0ACB8A9G8_9AGAM|nr:hypothetical protein BJ138DRAFT_1154163 [Hygrophoropsis aurantiaca]